MATLAPIKENCIEQNYTVLELHEWFDNEAINQRNLITGKKAEALEFNIKYIPVLNKMSSLMSCKKKF